MKTTPHWLAITSFLLVACGGAGGKGAESASSDLVGNPAPEFSVTAMNASKSAVSLKDLQGKVILVDFWGTFCDPCKKSFPKLEDLSAKYSASGLQVVGISEDEPEDKDKITSFADTYGAKFPVGWDATKAIARSYKPPTMPSSFIIDRKGVVRYAHVGYHDGEEVEIEKEVKELLDQK
jgi:peroxiredoxin